MAELTLSAPRERAADAAGFVLVPIATDNAPQALNTTKRFGTFVAGDSLVISATDKFHMVAGTSAIDATTSHPLFPAGVYKFTIPDGCTHVAMIQASGATASGQAYKG
jgi:hypothetical protein